MSRVNVGEQRKKLLKQFLNQWDTIEKEQELKFEQELDELGMTKEQFEILQCLNS